LITLLNLFFQKPAQLPVLAAAEGVGVMFGVVAFDHHQANQLLSTLGPVGQLRLLRRRRKSGCRRKGLAIFGQDGGINGIGFGALAWAMFSNHYHFVGHSPVNERNATSLPAMFTLLHEKTAKWANRLDSKPQRKVWFNYRETRLTYQKSYFARLNYTHQNPVKHGLVASAHLYPWCSASWFERSASAAQVKAIYRFRTDGLKVEDAIEVAPEW
jgi:putative transposase